MLNSYINARINYLEKICSEKEHALHGAPEGILRGIRHGNGFQYFLRAETADHSGTYIKADNKELVKKLGQKEYDKRVIKAARNELKVLKRPSRYFANGTVLTVEGVYGKLSPWEKAVVDPIEKTDAAYVKEWLESPSQGLPFKADDPFTFFYKGVRMRSMSEVYIATLLDNYNIPFLYEKPLKLAGRVIYPDFSALDMRNRREVYWEHMGLMDNPGYYQDAVRKIRSYTYSGIYLGDRLLITQGTSYSGLDMSEAERLLCWRFGKKNVLFSSKIAGRGGA